MMKRLVIVALLLVLTGTSGCSFLMKEYDDRNERKLAEISEENQSLVSKVRNLERKVPEMNRHIQNLEAENQQLKQKMSNIDSRLASTDITTIAQPETKVTEYAPPSESEYAEGEEPFTLSETDETAPPKPEVQAPKSKLTPEAERIMQMAQKKEGVTTEAKPSTTMVPKPEAQEEEYVEAEAETEAAPAPAVKAEEEAPKSKLTPDAERIMALAKKKAGMTEESKPETKPVPKPAPKPEPKPAPAPAPVPTAKPETKPAEGTSTLTPEAERILAMSRGEKAPSEGAESKTTPPKPAPKTASAKMPAPQIVKLKVLSGNGNIESAKKMAKSLESLGYKSDAVALAPRSNFEQTTVYYAKGFEATANDIKRNIGGNAITKPLSWGSEFDVIVVAAE